MDDWIRPVDNPRMRNTMQSPAMDRRVRLLCGALLLACALPVDAATIYLCRAHGGGEFWSAEHCHKRSASIVRMASVPDGMPFEQQVRLVDGQLRKDEARNRQEDQERERLQQCAQLKAERDQIWGRYGNWQFQKGEVIGQDRTRWKVIESEQRRLNCQQR